MFQDEAWRGVCRCRQTAFRTSSQMEDVIKQLGEHLNENIQQIATRPESLIILDEALIICDNKECGEVEQIKDFDIIGNSWN